MFQNLSFFDILVKGGPVFFIILGISIVSLTVIFERLIAIGGLRKNANRFRTQILARVRARKFEEAVVLCRETPGPLSDVFLSALERRAASKQAIEEAVEREGVRLSLRLEKHLHILATIGSITPFIGLFGTVIGIINAFQSISTSASYAPALVSNGIAEALVNTAAGLVVAIPSVLFFNWFTQRIETFIGEVQITCSEIIEVVAGDRL